MSITQDEPATSLRARIIGGAAAAVILAGLGAGSWAVVATAQEAHVAQQALKAAGPAYAGAGVYGATLGSYTGSQALTGDAGNDTSCLPTICFHITLPDPAHPECAAPFKP